MMTLWVLCFACSDSEFGNLPQGIMSSVNATDFNKTWFPIFLRLKILGTIYGCSNNLTFASEGLVMWLASLN